MRIDLSTWNEENFVTRVREFLSRLVEDAKSETKTGRKTLHLIKSTSTYKSSVNPIKALNALMGRLGRMLELDEELGLAEEHFKDITVLTLSGFTLTDLKTWVPFFSKNYYPFVQQLEFDISAKCAEGSPKLTTFEIGQLARSSIYQIHLRLSSDNSADQEICKQFASALSAIKHMHISLLVNSTPSTFKANTLNVKNTKHTWYNEGKKPPASKKAQDGTALKIEESIHKNNFLICCFDLVRVIKKSNQSFLFNKSSLDCLNLFLSAFHYYSQDRQKPLRPENPALEAIYLALFPNDNGKSPLLMALKVCFATKPFLDKLELAWEAGLFFYKEFILCGQATLPSKAETLAAWHDKLSQTRNKGHLPRHESLEDVEKQIDMFTSHVITSSPAQTLLKRDLAFSELLFSIVDLYYRIKNENADTILNEIQQVLQLVVEFNQNFGLENTQIVIQKCCSDRQENTHYLPQLLSLGLQFSSYADFSQRFFQLITQYLLNEETWPLLKGDLDHLLLELQEKRFPSRPLPEILKSFRENPDVFNRLNLTELKQYEQICQKIDAFAKEFFIASDEILKQIIENFKNSKKGKDSLTDPKILAVLRELIRRFYGAFAYNVQLINAMAILNAKKRLAQIKAGEGKSTIIPLVAGMYVLNGHTVDVITINADLATRDPKKYQKFFEFVGKPCAYLSDKKSMKLYLTPVLYGSCHDFRHAFLLRMLGVIHTERPFDVAIVDEADSMCIDTNESPTIISNSARHPVVVYKMLWAFIKAFSPKDISTSNVKSFLRANNIELTDTEINRLLAAAAQALKSLEGIDYVIENGKVIIVDHQHTGALLPNSRWNEGLHSFLEVEHNLKVNPDDLQTASINNYDYFRQYSRLLGVTGTLGSKSTRADFRYLYKVDLYDSPRYLPSLKRILSPILAENQKQQFDNIISETLKSVALGRPVLIITPNIKISLNLFETFGLVAKELSKQLYNGIQEPSSEHVIAVAGNPGMITIATNKAGRGADIVPTPEAEAKGGLDEITIFPTINSRVEEQAFCRTGRQGRRGTCRYILNKEDLKPYFETNMPEKDEDIIKAWKKERAKLGKKHSIQERNEKHYNDIVFALQSVFWQFLTLRSNTDSIQALWPKTFDTIFYTIKTARNNKLFNDQDFRRIVHEVTEQFLDFCKTTNIIPSLMPKSGGNILHFLAKRGMTRPVALFAFHQPSLLLEQDAEKRLPWALASKRNLQTAMKALTEQETTQINGPK